MRQRTTILVQNETLGAYQLRPGKRPVVIGSADDADLQWTGGDVRQWHAGLQWRDGRWVLFDLDGKPGILEDRQWFTWLDVAEPRTVRLGGPSGPVLSLTPLPRPASRWRGWSLAGLAVLVAAAVVATVVLTRDRAVDHRPFPTGACIDSDRPWSAGQGEVRPSGHTVDCRDAFDYKVLGVIPVATPEVTIAYTPGLLARMARKLAYGGCPPGTWPALGQRDAHGVTHEIYCVQDSVYTVDRNVLEEGRDFNCLLRDGKDFLLATSCGLRHDYVVREIKPLAPTKVPSQKELDRIGRDGCQGTPDAVPFLGSRRTWAQGYQRLLCLQLDNMTYNDSITWALDDLRAYWDREVPDASSKPSGVLVRSEKDYDPSSPPQCDGDPLKDNARYCAEDDSVAWDPQWLRRSFYDRYGDIAVAVVLAHEWGHVVQSRLGLYSDARWDRLSTDEARRQELVRREYQADCYAGVWLAHYYDDADKTNVIPFATDRNKAVHAIVDIGDWSTADAESFQWGAHGDALKRMENLVRGYRDGQPACRALLPT